MKKMLYTGIRVLLSQTLFCFLLVSGSNAQTTYLSVFANATGNYTMSQPSCVVNGNLPNLVSPEKVATETLTDYASLTTPLVSTSVACNNSYTLRAKLNLGGLSSVPATPANPYYAGFRISISSLVSLNLLTGSGSGSNFTLKTFLNGTQVQTITAAPLGLDLLSNGVPSNIYFEATQSFNEVQIEVAQGLLTLGAISTTNFYYAYASTVQVPVILPVKLTDFTARQDGKNIQLNWKSASEQNLVSYEVEKSAGNNKFTSITKVFAGGNTNGAAYSATDKTVVSGESLYRLKITNRDGSVEYSKTISITNGAAPKWKVYPTILGSGTDVNVVFATGNSSSKTQVQLANLQGQTLRSISAADNKVVIQTSGLAAGIYIMKLYSDGQLQGQEKIVVQ